MLARSPSFKRPFQKKTEIPDLREVRTFKNKIISKLLTMPEILIFHATKGMCAYKRCFRDAGSYLQNRPSYAKGRQKPFHRLAARYYAWPIDNLSAAMPLQISGLRFLTVRVLWISETRIDVPSTEATSSTKKLTEHCYSRASRITSLIHNYIIFLVHS